MTDHGLVVYGYSDDLIIVDGMLTEEFGAYDADRTYLAFSDGTLISIVYDEMAEWKIQVHASPNKVHIEPAGETGEGYPDYSDVATVVADGPVRWVVTGERVVMADD